MNHTENTFFRAEQNSVLKKQLDKEKTGINRMLTFIEKWEKEFNIRSVKNDLEEFRFSLEAKKKQIDSQFSKLSRE